jgi:Tfp pilus assembly protein PilV
MNAKRKREAGFTIIEVIIAIIVLTVGLLGLVTTAALVTRMITRGQRSSEAATWAARRMERLRPRACVDAQRTAGSDTLYRGGIWQAINTWTFTDAGDGNYRVQIITLGRSVQNRIRTDTTEATIPCL